MKTLVFLVLLGVAFAADEDEKVVGGYECPEHSVPHQVSLNAGYHFCGGSLISSEWVLTAAHCYHPQIQVRLGEHNLAVNEGTEQWIDSAEMIRHPRYDVYSLDHDIMLIRLSKPATLDSHVQPVALPSRCPLTDEECMVSGWGNMAANGNNFPDKLQCLKQPIIDDAVCMKVYSELFTDNMVCSGFMKGGASSCQGDSGGPLVCDGQLQGLVSWGEECAMRGHPSVYVRVCRYTSWISSVMNDN